MRVVVEVEEQVDIGAVQYQDTCIWVVVGVMGQLIFGLCNINIPVCGLVWTGSGGES